MSLTHFSLRFYLALYVGLLMNWSISDGVVISIATRRRGRVTCTGRTDRAGLC